ncbi:MAG: outer membrane lipoprotein carrier protein LolA [Prevotellaceae bacterium]|nr:outer membrane lipoprotein carrier protein LolA [Prevotellaceae bacterium]
MKRLFTLLLAATLAASMASAQQTDIRKAAGRYKGVTALTTQVTQTTHNAALTEDAVTSGHFYYKDSEGVSMVFKETGEMLIATDNTFTMVKDGKEHVAKASGKGDNPFEVLRDVFRNLLSGNDNASLTDMADVNIDTQGNTCTLTITPATTDAKMKRRMMYTSCVAAIDLKSSELRSLRIYQRGENYTQYDFSKYEFNTSVDSGVFDAGTVTRQ